MVYTITNRCIRCDSCLPSCPTGAIQVIDDQDFWIDPSLCNNCEGYSDEPQCVISCPVGSPIPFQAKKGRCKVDVRTGTNPDLFSNGKNTPFASAIVVWELCNILAQRQSLPWETNTTGKLHYQRQINQGRNLITFHITDVDANPPIPLENPAALNAIAAFDIRAACMHLIYAAYAASLDNPWEQEFVINDRQIEEYLGLDKRKDLSKMAKLTLIKDLAQQPCRLQASMDWNQHGKIMSFSIRESRLWHLVEIQNHFQDDDLGCKHLVGLTFKVRAGLWAKYFLNQQGYKKYTAFYQYGILPKSLLSTVMSIWQQHEGTARIMLWLLFKTKIGREQRVTVRTLMRIAYGEDKVIQASSQREGRKRLLRTFESDLEVLNRYGLKPIFDRVTYPPEIQPFWAKLAVLPDDAEAALEFWMNDASSDTRLTDAAPRGKWNRLMNARILSFELPEEWGQKLTKSESKKQSKTNRKSVPRTQPTLSSEEIIAGRKQLNLSQRALADRIGKSQSWVRDVENGRLNVNSKDLAALLKVLEQFPTAMSNDS